MADKSYDEHRLRTAYQALCEGLDDGSFAVDLMLFTTFEYNPDFFEQNILSELDPSVDRLQTLEEVENAEELAEEHGVVVFHDIGRLSTTARKAVGLPTVPVGVRGGFFHPKVVLVSGVDRSEGDRQVRLMVSSANLTRAGWGLNVEGAGCIANVRTPEVARPLVDFLEYLQKHAKAHLGGEGGGAEGGPGIVERIDRVVEHLEGVEERASGGGTKLHVTLPKGETRDEPRGREGGRLFRYLENETEGPLCFGAPYFSAGDGNGSSIFDELEECFGDRGGPDSAGVTVVPGWDVDERVELDKAGLELLKGRDQLAIQRLPWPNGEPRRQHLKYIVHGSGTIVGSHNTTFAALGGPDGGPEPKNVEVSLEWPRTDMWEALEEIEWKSLEPKEVVEPPEPVLEDDEGKPVPRVSLVVDWAHELIELIEYESSGDDVSLEGFGVGLIGGDPVSLTKFVEEESASEQRVLSFERFDLERASLAENKQFTLYRMSDGGEFEQVYVGFFNERNRENRVRYREPSLGGCLTVWCRSDGGAPEPSDEAQSDAFGDSNSDREAHQIERTLVGSQRTLDNYFHIYRAAAGMREYLGLNDDTNSDGEGEGETALKARDVRQRVRTVLKTSSASYEHIVQFLQARDGDEDEDTSLKPLPRALLGAEFLQVIGGIKRLIERSEVEDDLRRFKEPVAEYRLVLEAEAEKLSSAIPTNDVEKNDVGEDEQARILRFLHDSLRDETFFEPVFSAKNGGKDE